MNNINEIIKGKYYEYSLCIRTDGADFTNGIDCSNPEKILEMRCFDENGELRLFRSSVDDSFHSREIIDSDRPKLKVFSKQWEDSHDDIYQDYYDVKHYLDIASISENGNAVTIGGGKYFLPNPNARIIRIRYYIKYDDNGIAQKVDWRLVGF